MSGICAAVLAVVIISTIIGCVICQKKRKKSKLELFALTNRSRNNRKTHCCSKLEESNCSGGDEGNIYDGLDNGADDGNVYVGPDSGPTSQYGIYENVEVKKDSTLSNVECKFTDDAEAESVYENTENHRRQLVEKRDLDAVEFQFYDKPKVTAVKEDFDDQSMNIYQNAAYGLEEEENIYVNT